MVRGLLVIGEGGVADLLQRDDVQLQTNTALQQGGQLAHAAETEVEGAHTQLQRGGGGEGEGGGGPGGCAAWPLGRGHVA